MLQQREMGDETEQVDVQLVPEGETCFAFWTKNSILGLTSEYDFDNHGEPRPDEELPQDSGDHHRHRTHIEL